MFYLANVACYEPFQQYKGYAIVTVDGDLCYNWKDANREYNPIAYPDKGMLVYRANFLFCI